MINSNMVLLKEDKYDIALESLKEVQINNLFARTVLEKKTDGTVYANNALHPTAFYVVHPYGMSLLYGTSNDPAFNTAFKAYALNDRSIRKTYEWMQAYPNGWDVVLKNLFGDRLIPSAVDPATVKEPFIQLNTRVNFKFNSKKYSILRKSLSAGKYKVIRTNEGVYEKMTGSVIPRYFWRDAAHFCSEGVGFSLVCDDMPASTAYSAFIIDDKLELGIETAEMYRGNGFAQYVCSALIDYCVEHNYEPVWSCRLENSASYYLAQKLGFEPTKTIPYYRLGK